MSATRSRRRVGWGLTRLTVVATSLLALLIGLAFSVLLWAISDTREAAGARKQVRAALFESGHLERLVLDVETGERGFLITKQERFLQPWESARAAFPGQAEELLRDTEGSPELRTLAHGITRDAESFIQDYSVPLVDAARQGDPAASSVETTDEGKRRVDALRAQFDRFEMDARSLLAAREQAAEDKLQLAIDAATAGLAGSVALVVAYTGYLTRAVVQPVRKAASVASRLAGGDLSARMPQTGGGEIGELAVAFNAMGDSLEESHRLTEVAHRRLKLLYDASVAVGTTLDVRRTAQELVQVVVPGFADFATVDLAVSVVRGDEEPPGERATMSRVAVGGIRDAPPLHPEGALVTWAPITPQARSFVSGLATVEPDLRASAAWQSADPEGARRILDHGIHSLITAPLCARGVPMGVVTFWRSRQPRPFEAAELSYAAELAAKAAVAIDNARRYTRERDTALTLQRSLLPQRLPAQSALEIASRYLPAGSQAGVGGDWFDVIPLSGARVALVVGDVVGHGIHASATMGRLRTAVRTLADVDLPPDELLTHLDDLVIHFTGDEEADMAHGDAAAFGELGATCLYAVYDPVSRRCTLATAGHPLPVVVAPDGIVELVKGPIGPPLGLGGLPFETIELHLAPGSVLALFSDGLITSRGRDVDQGISALCRALALPTASLEETCDTVTDALLDGRPADDVALLVARTGALSPDRVVTWDVTADPVQVAHARTLATDQLHAWGLAEVEFITELVVSELVTNAIRYGAPPIQLRLIRDRALICEVSDGSSTAPHLRRARVFDEGGRGLLLVAQLTQGWGTRQTASGKTIWCEQTLPGSV
ncbi:SpoIIE family protein phosphatase [Streptomyces himalayensis]|uniref:SpoIIE family protein phosphatase n=1 Tax=Streptomyces himalayensis subsp. himalayensis TaxID=2756131 RepID=A0A7W0DJF3_9ACTN|nr:SpoIIE family protein phosphatase [Streptomyces himalayensis]MBA2945778.1 SpoIIE family protein phosphatase [Streptomyces himalayensis subsp. himalayensis]